jgi:SOS-response transcriptional repressor LexA
MIGLTPRERDCLDAIKRLTVDGVPPTFEQLRAELGVGSKSTVHRLVHGLHRRGAIAMRAEAKRSIRVLDDFEGLERRTSQYLRALRARADLILAMRERRP